MDCLDMEKLYSYILEQMTGEEIKNIGEHIRACESCKERKKELEEDIEKIKCFLKNYDWDSSDEDKDDSSPEDIPHISLRSDRIPGKSQDMFSTTGIDREKEKSSMKSFLHGKNSDWKLRKLQIKLLYLTFLKEIFYRTWTPARKLAFAGICILIVIFSFLLFLPGPIHRSFLAYKYGIESTLSSQNPGPLYNMGLLKRDEGKIFESRDLLQKAYLLNNNYSVSYYDFGEGYYGKLKKIVIFSGEDDNEDMLYGISSSAGSKLSLVRTLSPGAVETFRDIKKEDIFEDACRAAGRLGGDYLLFMDGLSSCDDEWSLEYTLVKLSGHKIISKALLTAPSLAGLEFKLVYEVAKILCGNLTEMEEDIIKKYSFTSEKAFELYLEGKGHYYRYTEEDNERAIELFRQAIELEPESPLIYSALADALIQEYGLFSDNDPDLLNQSRDYANKALAGDPLLAEGHKSLGLIFIYEGKKEEAIGEYKKALEINENYTEAYINLGMLYLNEKELDKASEMFKQALYTNESSPEAHKELANSYFLKEDFNKAIDSYRQALHIGFLNAHSLFQTYNNLSLCYRYRGMYKEALKNMKEALTLKPNYGPLYFEIAEAFRLNGDKKEALENYRLYLEYEPEGKYRERTEITIKLMEENKGRVDGLVVSHKGEPLSALKVIFKKNSSSFGSYEGPVDERGFYSLTLPEGNYKYVEVRSEEKVFPVKSMPELDIRGGCLESFDIYLNNN